MSNQPDEDPIAHAAKFLWIFAAIPVIFGAMPFFLPPEMSDSSPAWARAIPFVAAALIALIGLGVKKRIPAAAWAGIALFALGIVALGVGAITGEPKKRGVLFFGLLFLWPIKKLFAALEAMRRETPAPR
ncbi:MAG: hypothetical protein U0359_13325 [Byssovorax sp.]